MAGRTVRDEMWNERREWIRKQRESGLSVAQFCRDHGLHLGNFHAWRLRIAELDAMSEHKSMAVTEIRSHGSSAKPTFLQGERSAKYILWSVVGSMVLFPFTQELNHGSFQRFEQSRVLATGS